MAKNSEEKTNVMRVLAQKKIEYKSYSYEADPHMTGTEIAGILGEDASKVFKTLVTLCFRYTCGEGAGPKKSCQGSFRKGYFNASAKRAFAFNRLCSWRLFANWHEEELYHCYPRGY